MKKIIKNKKNDTLQLDQNDKIPTDPKEKQKYLREKELKDAQEQIKSLFGLEDTKLQ